MHVKSFVIVFNVLFFCEKHLKKTWDLILERESKSLWFSGLSVCRACHIEIRIPVASILNWCSETSAEGNFTSLSESEFNIPWSYADIKLVYIYIYIYIYIIIIHIYIYIYIYILCWSLFKLDKKTNKKKTFWDIYLPSKQSTSFEILFLRSFSSTLILWLNLFLSFHFVYSITVPIF